MEEETKEKERKNEKAHVGAEIEVEAKPKAIKKRRKLKRVVAKGLAYIKSSFNNTIVTITDQSGNVIAWASSGSLGFKGSRKGTPYTAGMAAKTVAAKVKNLGMTEVDVFVKGIGSGRETAIRSLASEGLTIGSIKDTTPIPHNGCRAKKVRRV